MSEGIFEGKSTGLDGFDAIAGLDESDEYGGARQPSIGLGIGMRAADARGIQGAEVELSEFVAGLRRIEINLTHIRVRRRRYGRSARIRHHDDAAAKPKDEAPHVVPILRRS